MGKFNLVILWRNGESGIESNLSWPDVQLWFQSIHETASQDLVQQVLVVPTDFDPMRITSQRLSAGAK